MRGNTPVSRVCVVACACALLSALFDVNVARAEDARLDWGNVLKLRNGEHVDVELEGKRYSGKVDNVDPDSLSMTTGDGRSLVLPRPTVKAVRDSGRLRKLGWILLSGGALGTGAAVLGGTVRDANALSAGRFPQDDGGRWEIAGLAVMGVGGWFLATGGGKVIYKRPGDQNPPR
jgi:hypothetical protein